MSQLKVTALLQSHGLSSTATRQLLTSPTIDWTKLLGLVEEYGPLVVKILEVVIPAVAGTPAPTETEARMQCN